MIVTYRDLSEQTDAALTMFGDGEAASHISVVRPYKELLAEYLAYMEQLQAIAAPGAPVYGEAAEQQFVETFSALLRHHNVVKSFEAFDRDNPLDEYDLADSSPDTWRSVTGAGRSAKPSPATRVRPASTSPKTLNSRSSWSAT